MAVETPSLMYAVLTSSAMDRLTRLNGYTNNFMPETLISELMSTSLRHLREELEKKDRGGRQALLHTIKTLCIAEIYSGKADSSWRVHIDGARAVLESMCSHDDWFRSGPDYWLTGKWYPSIEALAALTDRGFTKWPRLIDYQGNRDGLSLDIYAGYTADLNRVMQKVGEVAQQRLQLQLHDSENPPEFSEMDIEREAMELENTLRSMIQRDSDADWQKRCELPLTSEEIRQFGACNTAFQYSVLIHVYRRIRNLDQCSSVVQECVRKILDALCNILPMTDLSPWVLVTTPIYVAGSVFYHDAEPPFHTSSNLLQGAARFHSPVEQN